MRNRRRESASDVVGDVSAAYRHIVGENQVPIEKYPDRRRPTPHVDHGHAEPDLILYKAGKSRRVWADDQSLDLQMRPPDRRGVVANAGAARRHHVHIDPEPLAEHAARITNAAAVIDRKPNRHRMDDLTVARLAQQVTGFQRPSHIGVGDLAPGDPDLGPDNAGCGKATREVCDNTCNRLARHFFRGVHGVQNGSPGRFEVDDGSAAQAARDLMANSKDPRLVVIDPRNEAADLRRADIECSYHAAARPDRRLAQLCLALGSITRQCFPTLRAGRWFVCRRHVFFADGRPFLDVGASLETSGFTRTTSRSGRRTSTTCTSRLRMALDRSRFASSAHALAGESAGSNTSIALSIRKFQRRSPTRMAALTRAARSGSVASMSSSFAAWSAACSPTTSGSFTNLSRCPTGMTVPSRSSKSSLPPCCHRASGLRSTRRT